MPAFMYQSQEVNRVSFNLVINVKRKRLCAAARKAMGSHMVAAFPPDHFANHAGHALMKIS